MEPMIRFLPTDDDGFFWVKRSEYKPEKQLLCQNYKKKTYVNVLPVIGHWLPELKPSKHRSKRVWKKLNKNRSTLMYGQREILSLSPETLQKLMK